MKTVVQPIVCAIALAALLGGAASQATPLAELPLKTSVLAKPNVIFGDGRLGLDGLGGAVRHRLRADLLA